MLEAQQSAKGAEMATFMDVHEGFVGVTAEDFKAAHEADLRIEAEEGVHFEKAWLDPVSGKAFCISTGPDKEAVMRVHERAGHPTAEVYEVPIEV
ncbi:SCO4226 family nickel-binding protein [Catelliglobosispora koreensis]|uniref:SCO4226 family nickel-binding protein n=1 Tax=Catelliglobosispora koreensis TaxID=129052 RepID=UPI001FE13212|nr:SCO4226 family nickel-binding protein [Catelliglobosispora koreensis]